MVKWVFAWALVVAGFGCGGRIEAKPITPQCAAQYLPPGGSQWLLAPPDICGGPWSPAPGDAVTTQRIELDSDAGLSCCYYHVQPLP
jgi:hypothetical protein